MRQAGRYLPEYRALRAQHGFLELCKTPTLAAEVTLMPIERFPVDAAILFADILLVLEPMGVGLEFAQGDGPVIHRPVRTRADVDGLARIPAARSLGYVFETVREVRRRLPGRVPLVGGVPLVGRVPQRREATRFQWLDFDVAHGTRKANGPPRGRGV